MTSTRRSRARVGQPEGDAVEEAQSVAIDVAALPAEVAFVVKEQEVILDLLGAELVGAAMIMACEADDGAQVRLLGVVGESANGHIV